VRVLSWALLLVLGAGAGFAIARLTGEPGATLDGALDSAEPREIHASFHTFEASARPKRLTISHDGRSLAWTDGEGIWIRELADPAPRRLRAVESIGEWGPRWSPDDSELAYIADGSTWRVGVNGGRPERVVGGEAPDTAFLDWLPDGRLVFGTPERVWTMPADGGAREVLLELEDEGLLAHWHAILPLEGGGFLGALHRFSEAFGRLELFRDGEVSTVFEAGVEIDEIQLGPIALGTGGFIVYDAKIDETRSIWSVPFSLEDLRATGPARLEVEDAVLPSVARDGSLAYLQVDYEPDRRQMAWLRPGEAQLEPFDEPRAALGQLRLSPDGRKVAFTTWKPPTTTVWVRDLDRGLAAPAIQIDGIAFLPLWMDDEHIAISSFQEPSGAFVHSLVGRGEPRHLSEDVLYDTSPDGEYFVFATIQRDFDDAEFRTVGPGADGPALGFLDHEDRDRFEGFAPDGAWMLYSSKRSGTRQLYLTAFPPGDEQWLVTPGETSGVWFSQDLDAIYFVSGERPSPGSELYRIAVTLGPRVELGVPEVVRQLEPDVRIDDYDGSDRFLVRTGSAPTRSQAFIHTGWARRAAAR
jgi:Tol biopolymer transport system component